MATFVPALAIFVLAVAAMAVGTLFQGRRLKGSCGGAGEGCSCSPLAARTCPVRRERDARRLAGAG
ncbi:MAG: hypothetical protein JRG83_18400 [Deltaproteobacteria bacterium]|nr:hypothetical protein [Deltaproteobacteria bacterium]